MLPNPEDMWRFSFTPFGRDLRSYEGREYAKILLDIYSGAGKAQWLVTSKWITYSENYVFVQSLSRVQLFATPWTKAHQASCPSPSPGAAQTHVHWVSDAIQSSCPLSSPSPPVFNLFPASGTFLMNWLFASGGHSTGASALPSVLAMTIQDWFPLGLIGLISFQSKGLSPGLLHCRWILYQLSHKRSRIILVTNLLLYIIGSSPPLIMPWHDLRGKGCIISRFSYVLLFATLWTVAH